MCDVGGSGRQGREVATLVARLGLRPHPEGGYYREIHRSAVQVIEAGDRRAPKSAGTGIYYLLPEGTFSAWHVVRGSDEGWHRYAGGVLELHLLDPDTRLHMRHLLTDDLDRGEPSATVPAGVWQAARPVPGEGWVLCGCTVAPGFDFADFELGNRRTLLEAFPGHAGIVTQLTPSG